MYREDTQTGSVIGTNTLYSQIQRNVSLNDIHINENEDAANVQDNNIARVFDYFLRSYVQQETYESEEDEDLDETVKEMFRYAKDRTKVIYYMKVACQLVLKESNSSEVLQVHLGHIMNWRYDDPDAPPNLNVQLYRYLVKNFLRMQEPLEDVVQFLANELSNAFSRVPRKFYVQFLHDPTLVYPLKELKCNMLGELVCVRGQVTRVSDVRPELVRATFKCKTCGTVVGDVVQQFKYTTPTKCPSNNCLNSTDWELMMDHSFFCDWQKIRIQEVAQEADSGSMPCSIEVILRNKLVDTVNAGDRVQVSGSLIVVPDIPSMLNATQLGEVAKKVMRQGAKRFESFLLSQGITGIKGVGAKQLNHKLCFLATQVIVVNQARASPQFTEIEDKSFIAEDLLSIPGFEWVREVSRSRDTIDRLSRIIAPNVWGNYEIKKGLLLLLVGGVHKSSRDAKLRGDINMCIVGDPSTAKSQFLKFVESFAPRAVYTSGKGSTAAGLTAAVFRDRDNNDYVLEAGALMYADEGICCIDEFDKMNERDRVSIHEAMEQQTISISKAGIQATLNARASVLAACNPRYGRYDTSKSFKENVNIPSPLLSRFDLLYTILDENNNQVNRQISEYVCNRYNQYTSKSSPQVADLNLERNEERRRRARENLEMELDDEEVESVEVDYYKLSKWDEYTSPNYVNPNRRFASTNRGSKEGANQTSANSNTSTASRRGDSQQESNVEGEAEEEMTLDELRLYIELCKRLKPLMQDSAKHKLSDYYIELRNGDVGGGRRSMRMTVRQLESLVRLSEAVAKLKFSDFVTDEHVQIAYSVFKSSLLKLTNKSSVKLTFGNETARSSMETDRSAEATQEGASARRYGGEVRGEESELVSTIGLDLYNDISAVLLDKVSESELRGNLLANNELVEWYLEEVLVPRNEAEANEWNLKLQQIVHRLAFVDSKLLPAQLEGDPENIYRLRVHPNYFSHTHLFSRKQDQYTANEGEEPEEEEEEFIEEDQPEETQPESQVSQQE
ncbi:replication licensing factor [Theileria orientalis]|uniref:DNA replication licensing factor MCM6 n=1 Tax=Theileria orientalis TaxID=68886 RepID=A0A976MDE6_THEOR|nr:replication licensing factor [Theileria orientalis]